MGDAADGSGGPLRLTDGAYADRCGRVPDPGERRTGAPPGRHELPSPRLDGPGYQVFLAGKDGLARDVAERLDRDDRGRQQLLDHDALTPRQ
jgi:hypothetical protein